MSLLDLHFERTFMHWGKQMVVVQSVYRLTSFGGYCSVFQLGKCVEVFWVVIVTSREEQVT